MNRSVLRVLRRDCLVALATLLVLFLSALPAAAKKLNIVTSTTDMASLAQEVIERILQWLQFEVCSARCELFLEL